MGASERTRRPRYQRSPQRRPVSLTPNRRLVLQAVARYRLLSSPQLTRAVGLSPKATQRAARSLFDGGLLEVLPVPRAALLEESEWGSPAALFGSAPNVYHLSRAGREWAKERGEQWVDQPVTAPRSPTSSMLRHELLLSDLHLYMELSARKYSGHALEQWYQGGEAEIALPSPRSFLRPDGWFVYRMRDTPMAGFVEIDRGTERGDTRWAQKLRAYEQLLSENRLKIITGYQRGRLLVVTPDLPRRDRLSRYIASGCSAILTDRVWLTEAATLATGDIGVPLWVRPGRPTPEALVPGNYLYL